MFVLIIVAVKSNAGKGYRKYRYYVHRHKRYSNWGGITSIVFMPLGLMACVVSGLTEQVCRWQRQRPTIDAKAVGSSASGIRLDRPFFPFRGPKIGGPPYKTHHYLTRRQNHEQETLYLGLIKIVQH